MQQSEGRANAHRTFVIAGLLAAMITLVFALAACGSNAQQSSSSSESAALVAEEQKVVYTVFGEEADLEPTGAKNVLVIGDDAWEKEGYGNADMMCMLHIDFDAHEITELSISRETRHQLEDGHDTKLNSVLAEKGPVAQTVAASKAIDEPIDYYVRVGFDQFMAIVDYFDGVEADLPYPAVYSFYTHDYPDESYEAGEQTLTSWRAMAISRSRTSYADQGLPYPEMIRQCVDRATLTRLMQYAYAHEGSIPVVFEALASQIDSNVPIETLIEWAQALGETGTITVNGTTGPYATVIDDENGGIYLAEYDPDGWANMISAINNHGDLEEAFNSYLTTDIADNVQAVTTTEITVG